MPGLKVIAAAYIKGAKLNPSEVTAAVGVAPTSSQTRGEARRISAGATISAKTGLWALIVERDGMEVSAVLTELLNALGPQSGLSNLPDVEEAYFDIFVAALSNEDGEGTCEFGLVPSQSAALATYGLPVKFTVNMGKP